MTVEMRKREEIKQIREREEKKIIRKLWKMKKKGNTLRWKVDERGSEEANGMRKEIETKRRLSGNEKREKKKKD